MRRLVVLVMLVLCGLGLSVAPATADGGSLLVDVPGDAVGFTHDPTVPLVHVERLAPGSSPSSGFAVRNTSPDTARLVLTVLDLVDDENGCLRQELAAPDEECYADGGELSAALVVDVTRDDQPQTSLWSGNFRDLSRGVQLTDALPAGATWPLHVTITMLRDATNATMSDVASFGVRLTAEYSAGYSAVSAPGTAIDGDASGHQGSAQAAAAPGSSVLGPLASGPRVGLPMTGASISLAMLLVDAALLLLGGVLVAWSRRRPAPRHLRSSA
jgi:hypothetical protein